MTWAARQRQIFLRQRQERALSYVQSGLPLRPAYALAASGLGGGDDWSGGYPAAHASLQHEEDMDMGASRPHTTGSIGSYMARWGNSAQQEGGDAGVWGPALTGGEGVPSSPSISLPKPTFRKVTFTLCP